MEENKPEQENESTNIETNEEVPAASEQQAAPKTKGFDVKEWLNKNKKLVIALVVVILIAGISLIFIVGGSDEAPDADKETNLSTEEITRVESSGDSVQINDEEDLRELLTEVKELGEHNEDTLDSLEQYE